ncbi:alpha-glucosidase C-terminal domain-containing protein [Streptomyces sp. NBC_01506]|uniref:alpha-glucosidase C-terminal domain-containing protein n=1 Tax=Streptomyces sp. NBC_01506 TaxID=2903887 RepID=UPI00386F0DB3
MEPRPRRSHRRHLVRTRNGTRPPPAAGRTRVPAGDDPKCYALRRTSEDGKQTALRVYNFDSGAKNVTVDLTGTGIDTRQTPKDLYDGGKGPAIKGTKYTVSLPAYGFKILEVRAR